MGQPRRLTITLSPELASQMHDAIARGDYTSEDELILDALQDWQLRRTAAQDAQTALKADLALGMADLEAGNVRDFNLDQIVQMGRKLSGRFPYN